MPSLSVPGLELDTRIRHSKGRMLPLTWHHHSALGKRGSAKLMGGQRAGCIHLNQHLSSRAARGQSCCTKWHTHWVPSSFLLQWAPRGLCDSSREAGLRSGGTPVPTPWLRTGGTACVFWALPGLLVHSLLRYN